MRSGFLEKKDRQEESFDMAGGVLISISDPSGKWQVQRK
jgi:hypothetical protein